MDDYEKAQKLYLKTMRSVLTSMRRDWNGVLLPYIKLLEKTEDPQNVAAAAKMRETQERMVEALGRGDFEAMEAIAEEQNKCFDECSPNVKEQVEKVVAEMRGLA